METCPRCGSPLERLSLDEATTIACNRCGYADVPVDHEPTGDEFESWRDALERFYNGNKKPETEAETDSDSETG